MESHRTVIILGVLLLIVGLVECHSCKAPTSSGNGNKYPFTYYFCSDTSGDSLGSIVLDGQTESTRSYTLWPKDRFCMAIPNVKEVHTREYTVSTEVLSDIAAEKEDLGYPGLVFNVHDSLNYDFIFFRCHSSTHVYGHGYVRDGTMVYDYHSSGKFRYGPPKPRQWHRVKLHVSGHITQIFLNNSLVATIRHHFPNLSRAGPAILNGYKNRVFYRGFAVEYNCT